MNGIDFEQELYNRFGMVKDFTLGMRIAQAFYDLGCTRTAERYDEIEYNRQRAEEIIPNDLEEAAEEYFYHNWSDGSSDIKPQVKEDFIAGAKWQKQHDAELIEIAYNDGITIGMTEQKEQMIQEAVEGTVHMNWISTNGEQLDERLKQLQLVDGQKVRIIIVKEEENGQSD